MYWGANTDYMVIKNSRIRNTFADGINMTNGSTNNLVSNIEARATGDDSFALFSAIDSGGADMKDNIYENLTSILTWRAAGVAVYGGYANTFRNIYIADTLCYSGITISSLDFGYPMNGFGASPTTNFENISIVRAGGHFWGHRPSRQSGYSQPLRYSKAFVSVMWISLIQPIMASCSRPTMSAPRRNSQ